MFLFLFSDSFIDFQNLFFILLLTDEVHEESDDGEEPFPDVAFLDFDFLTVSFEVADLLFDSFFLLYDLFCGLFVIVKQESSLVLIDIARIAKNFSG